MLESPQQSRREARTGSGAGKQQSSSGYHRGSRPRIAGFSPGHGHVEVVDLLVWEKG